jgi:alkylation response protein AidB-like acyl-CoA dehydrogenase
MVQVAAPGDSARKITDRLLFPAAMAVDAADRVPAAHLDALAEAGLYGLAGPIPPGPVSPGPVSSGGPAAGPEAICEVTEILASGCLATTFVWLQHHGAVRAVAAAPDEALRERWLEPLCRGTQRAGIALGGARPGPPLLRARPMPGGYLLDGTSPWVTGWGMIDTLLTVARLESGDLVTALVPASEGPTLLAERLRLVAVNASGTVQLSFSGHVVPADRVVGVVPHADWLARDERSLRPNGSLALGVAARCRALAGPGPLDSELARLRGELDAASPEEIPAARAAAAEFAHRAAGTLVVAAGSRAILVGDHAQRLAREALFLLVFGSRPAIKRHLAQLLAASPRPWSASRARDPATGAGTRPGEAESMMCRNFPR